MTSAYDFDPQPTQATAKMIHDALADKGTVLGSGTVILDGPRGDPEPETALLADRFGKIIHHFSTVTYIDGGGHLHAVLFDLVTTIPGTPSETTMILEILSDVAVS